MQERQVTLGSATHALPEPFMVMATQNPIEQEGTYPLPEAQVDRFMLKVILNYPTRSQERSILDAMGTTAPVTVVDPVVGGAQIMAARHVVNHIYIDDKVRDYIVDLVLATRDPRALAKELAGYIQSGASPARDDLPRARRPCECLPARPRLRHAARRQGCGARSAAASRGRQLRG